MWKSGKNITVAGSWTCPYLAGFLKASCTPGNHTFIQLPLIQPCERTIPSLTHTLVCWFMSVLSPTNPNHCSQSLATLLFLLSFECIITPITLYIHVCSLLILDGSSLLFLSSLYSSYKSDSNTIFSIKPFRKPQGQTTWLNKLHSLSSQKLFYGS